MFPTRTPSRRRARPRGRWGCWFRTWKTLSFWMFSGRWSRRLAAAIHLMLGRRVAGLALIVSEIAPRLLDELSEPGVPSVVYGLDPPKPNILGIKTQHRRGMHRLVEYLHSMGHRKFAFVGHPNALGPLSYGPRVQHETVSPATVTAAGGRRSGIYLTGGCGRPRSYVSTISWRSAYFVNYANWGGACRRMCR